MHPSHHSSPQPSLSRRNLLQVGAISSLGLSLSSLVAPRAEAAPQLAGDPTFGRAKNIIYLFLAGGPSQYETFDPKPNAPAEVRGIFQPISTAVPGIHISELLPRIASITDKLAIVRSMSTDDPNHESGGYWVNTGHKYIGPDMRALAATDWPTLGSLVKLLRPSEKVPLSAIQLPEPIIANPGVFLPGQNGGFLGRAWDPEFLRCDPSAPNFRVDGFELPEGITLERMNSRKGLLQTLDSEFCRVESIMRLADYDRQKQEAFRVLLSGEVKKAFALQEEKETLRDRYGRGKWGQSVLLARRLIESGVRMVYVNWPREPGDMSVGNPLWDTHSQNNPRMKDVLCPQFDLGFSALIEDLDQRGLLEETLVVAIGEMGRTPQFNAAGGRDHWGNVFSFVMAGAGIRTAQVIGSSDKLGANPASGRVTPGDLTATIFHLLGIGHDAFFPDRTGRPLRVTDGEPIADLLGKGPATTAREKPGQVIPSLQSPPQLLANGGFEGPTQLSPLAANTKGWQASPVWDAKQGDAFSIIQIRLPDARTRSGQHHVGIGYGLQTGQGRGAIPQGTQAILLQEVADAKPGQYTFRIHASGGALDNPAYYANVWCKHFTCRVVLCTFATAAKDPAQMVELASQTFVPNFAGALASDYRPYSVTGRLAKSDATSSTVQHGLAVAVIVEKTSAGTLQVENDGPQCQGLIRLDDAELEFQA